MRNVEKKVFVQTAHEIAKELKGKIEPNFESFLEFVYDYPGVINKKGKIKLDDDSSLKNVYGFLKAYLKQNFKARQKRIELKQVATVADPAVDVVLEVFGKHEKANLKLMMEYHRASMGAENKVGELLEAYLATKLEPQGWFWCSCSIIKGVDFFKSGYPVQLLQVKNRSNSENSSSAAIRKTLEANGCPVKIDKWYRTKSATGETNWENLVDSGQGKLLSEDGFHKFIKTYNIT